MNPYRDLLLQTASPAEMVSPIQRVEDIYDSEPLLPDDLPPEFYQSLMMLADQGPDWVPGVNVLTTLDTMGGYDEL